MGRKLAFHPKFSNEVAVKSIITSWRYRKLYRRAMQTACGKLYRDVENQTGNSIMIAGTARSGSTWLAELIASQQSCRIMFEPFHNKLVPEFQNFHYFHYMRPTEPNAKLLSYCRKIFTGQIRHWWIDRQVEHLFPRNRLIKEIRANLFLKWLKNAFPEVPLLFLVRHPCAVVSSRLKLRWATDSDIESFLSQPTLIEDFLFNKLDVICSAETEAEKHAIVWCIHHLVPFKQFEAPDLPVVFYEDLCLQPEHEIPRIFASIKRKFDHSVYARASIPSVTSLRQNVGSIDRWKKDLTSKQINTILRVVDAFGLGDIYNESPTPLRRPLQ
jgi:Sulfotransferase family